MNLEQRYGSKPDSSRGSLFFVGTILELREIGALPEHIAPPYGAKGPFEWTDPDGRQCRIVVRGPVKGTWTLRILATPEERAACLAAARAERRAEEAQRAARILLADPTARRADLTDEETEIVDPQSWGRRLDSERHERSEAMAVARSLLSDVAAGRSARKRVRGKSAATVTNELLRRVSGRGSMGARDDARAD